MSAIFIGYRRDDGGHARAIYEGLCYWYDAGQAFLNHECLPPGAKFRSELGDAIEHLAWLLERDPASLGADQRSIQQRLQDYLHNNPDFHPSSP